MFLKGRAKRHADATDGRGKKAKPVADFRMEGNRTVTYGKIEHVVGYLLLRAAYPLCLPLLKTPASKPAGFLDTSAVRKGKLKSEALLAIAGRWVQEACS